MKCVDREELTRFVQGKLESGRLIEVDEHLRACDSCKAALDGLPARAHVIGPLGASLIGVAECPEYEELSALVDGTLTPDRVPPVQAHVNSCELCAADVEHIAGARSHAALRQPVRVEPGISRRSTGAFLPLRRRLLAALTTAAAVAAIVIGMQKPPAPIQGVAVKPPEAASPVTEKPKQVAAAKPSTPAPVVQAQKPAPPIEPEPRTILKDGRYRLIEADGEMALARADGGEIRSALEARVARLIAQKIASGKIKPAKSYRVAMNTIQMRAPEGFTPSPTAPKPVSPVGDIVVSARPVFTWSRVDLADSYRLFVTDSKGHPVVDLVTEKTSAAPSVPLARGQVYFWQVGVRFSKTDEWSNASGAGFGVLSADDYKLIESVKRRMPGSHLALGAIYESIGLESDAASEYRALRRSNPGSPLARKLLYSTTSH